MLSLCRNDYKCQNKTVYYLRRSLSVSLCFFAPPPPRHPQLNTNMNCRERNEIERIGRTPRDVRSAPYFRRPSASGPHSSAGWRKGFHRGKQSRTARRFRDLRGLRVSTNAQSYRLFRRSSFGSRGVVQVERLAGFPVSGCEKRYAVVCVPPTTVH